MKKNLIELLSSPHIVAHFQRLCGVQWKYPDETNPIFPIRTQERCFNEQGDDVTEDDDVVITNKVLYHVMQLGSQLAGEPFYYAFLPICSWMLDVAVARKTLTSLALVMYIGQSAKDILRITRPPSPPVIRLEKMYETEYGMPSTHTIAGTVAPFALYAFSRQLYQIPDRTCLVAASVWTTWVATSRVYLGMHSFWQVVVGVLGAGSFLYSSILLNNKFDEALVNSSLATAGMVVSSMALSYFIFCMDSGVDPETGKPRWNTARGDQAEIMGFASGFLLGSKWAISHGLYQYRIPCETLLPVTHSDIKGGLIKFMAGGLMLIPAAFIVRKVCFIFFAKVAGVSAKNKIAAKRHPKVELPYKFTANLILGTVATSFMPWLLNELNLWH